MMGATGHLGHPLAQEVGGYQGRGEPMVGGAVAQLAVAIVTPSEHLSICKGAAGKVVSMLTQWLMFYQTDKRLSTSHDLQQTLSATDWISHGNGNSFVCDTYMTK